MLLRKTEVAVRNRALLPPFGGTSPGGCDALEDARADAQGKSLPARMRSVATSDQSGAHAIVNDFSCIVRMRGLYSQTCRSDRLCGACWSLRGRDGAKVCHHRSDEAEA